MESGHGVRASVASTRYSHDELSMASDHEAEGSLYTASFAATEPFDQTHSSFAFDDEASASFSTHRQRYDLSQSLEVEDNEEEGPQQQQEQQHEQEQQERGPARLLQQSSLCSRPSQPEPTGSLQAAGQTEVRPASGRQSVDGSLQRSLSRASTSHSRMRASMIDSMPARASVDSLRSRSSIESLPAQQQTHNDLQGLPARPSSSSPVKQPSSSRSRRHTSESHHQHNHRQAHHEQQKQPQQPQQQMQEQQPERHVSDRKQLAHRSSSGNSHASRKQQPQQPQQPPQQPRHKSLAEFEGDLSEWGRTNLEDFYEEDDQSVTSSQPTLSSGISPRDTKPRVKPFDLEAARETFAYNAGMYSRAQALRRDGTAPAAMGIADDLPTRMAYQQLHVLAGMAGKVQDAILHNKRIFEQRMMQQDRSLMKKVFEAWRGVRYGSVAKQAKLWRAVGRISKGLLSRAFFVWRDELHLVDKNLAMKRKVSATIARGLIKRSFLAWQQLAQERWWKNQLIMREREVALLEAKIRGYEKRPIQVLRKRKTQAVLGAWFAAAAARRDRRLAMTRAGKFWMNQQQSKAWSSWVEHCEVAARRRVLSQKVVALCQKLELTAVWNTWMDLVAARQEHNMKLAKAAQHWQQSLASKAWHSWAARAAESKTHRQIAARWMQPAKARAFAGWQEYVTWRQRNRLVVSRALARLRHGIAAAAFQGWLALVEERKLGDKVATKEGMQDSLTQLTAENERLRRDNERFVRLIDSGEWGRGRVAELVSAGEVMHAERDALLKLIGSLRREYEAVQAAKGAQEGELRLLKEKMTVGGPARNRLLVKGGSSFNALVRAMKQDLVDSGTAAKDPSLLYEIDKLSMDRVQVYPDGELNVQAIASAGTSAAFAKPVTRGRVPAAGAAHPRPSYSSPSHRPSSPAVAAAAGMSPVRGTLASSGGSLSSSSTFVRAGHSSPVTKSPAAPGMAGSLYTTLSVEAGAGDSGSQVPGGHAAASTQRVLQALSSLTPAQVDQLEAAVKLNALGHHAPGALAAGVDTGSPLCSGGRRPGL